MTKKQGYERFACCPFDCQPTVPLCNLLTLCSLSVQQWPLLTLLRLSCTLRRSGIPSRCDAQRDLSIGYRLWSFEKVLTGCCTHRACSGRKCACILCACHELVLVLSWSLVRFCSRLFAVSVSAKTLCANLYCWLELLVSSWLSATRSRFCD